MEAQTLTYIQAIDIIGGVSKPSKMPFYGWSTSAFDCQTGSKLREVDGSVCSDCYACKGNYCFENVRVAHKRRLNALLFDARFEEAMLVVIKNLYDRSNKTYIKNGKKIKENRWRWHDSGDIQSLEHLEMLNRIAEKLPEIDFWLPTKESGYVSKFLKKHKKFAPNLTVRLSHPMIGQTFTKKPQGLNFSTVGFNKSKFNCPAREQGNKCNNCNNCWNPEIESVNYPLH